ncbi:MAG: InlB B-repeat-containing protein, partial [Clostridia bacterium]|nr:InlB B-repeat-containing protein [Clostridia bacterium]
VTGTTRVGGIAAAGPMGYKVLEITGCANYAAVTGADYVGGIVGYYESESAAFNGYQNANYGAVTATAGSAGGLMGFAKCINKAYTMNVTGFLGVGAVSGVNAGGLVGVMEVQGYVASYNQGKTTLIENLNSGTSYKVTPKLNAVILCGTVTGSADAARFVGRVDGNTAPAFSFTDCYVTLTVTEKGASVAEPADYNQLLYVESPTDDTEHDGMTGYYARSASVLSYVMRYVPGDTVTPTTLAGTPAALEGEINASVATAGSAANVLLRSAMGNDAWPVWINGENYPVLKYDPAVYDVLFLDYDELTELSAITRRDSKYAAAPGNPTRDGYEFIGWKIQGGDDTVYSASQINRMSVSADITFVAYYKIQYTMIFNGKDGAEIARYTVTTGKTHAAPAAPAVEGFLFRCWRVGETNLTPDEVATFVVESDLLFTAIYDEAQTVTFLAMDGETVIASRTIVSGTCLPADSIPEAPAVEDMIFVGWTADAALYSAGDIAAMPVTAALTFTATYEAAPTE